MKSIKNIIQMHFPKKFMQTMFFLLISLFFLISCGEKDPAGTKIVLPTLEAVQANEANMPVEGGSLVIALPSTVESLNPYLCDTMEIKNVLSLVYEPLIQYDATGRLSAVLAEKWESIDEAGRTWRVTLRSNVFWQNSTTAFTAEDVLFSYQLIKGEEYENSYYRDLVDQIDSIIIENEKTIQVTGKKSGTMVLHSLVFPILPKTYMKQTQPKGTGPYIMTQANPTQGIYLNNNTKWWKNKPYIEQVRAMPMSEAEIPLGALEMGTLNYISSNVLTSNQYRDPGKVGMTEVVSQQNEMIVLNHRNSFLKELYMRQAIAYALDTRDIISKIYLNHAIATDVPISPSSWLYYQESKKYDVNQEKAKTLLQDNGWHDISGDGILSRKNENGLTERLQFRLLVNDTPDNQLRKDVANLIKEQLKGVGIDIQVEALALTEVSTKYIEDLRAGIFDMTLVGFNTDPNGDLTPFIGSKGDRNYGNYSNEEMDTLLEQYIAATEDRELQEVSTEIQKLFVEELPMIHLLFRSVTIGYSETIQFPENLLVREDNVFMGIEKWYLSEQGRILYPLVEPLLEVSWQSFDRPSLAEMVATQSDTKNESPANKKGVEKRTPKAQVAGSSSEQSPENQETGQDGEETIE